MVLEKLGAYLQKYKLDLYLSSFTKTNYKWIKDLNMKPETLKRLEENIGSAIPDLGIGKDLYVRGKP